MGLAPVAGALPTIWRTIIQVLGATKGGGLRFGTPGGIGGIIAKFISILGIAEFADWIFGMGGDTDLSDKIQIFLECVEQMETLGIIHPWTPRGQGFGNPFADGSGHEQHALPPKFLIFDLEKGQGFYTRFHMSRGGLQAHDDKQDTYKRPARARRRAGGAPQSRHR